jgi:hypothetical protein
LSRDTGPTEDPLGILGYHACPERTQQFVLDGLHHREESREMHDTRRIRIAKFHSAGRLKQRHGLSGGEHEGNAFVAHPHQWILAGSGHGPGSLHQTTRSIIASGAIYEAFGT